MTAGRPRTLDSGFKAYTLLFKQGYCKTPGGHFIAEQQTLREVTSLPAQVASSSKGQRVVSPFHFRLTALRTSKMSKAEQSLGHALKMIHHIIIISQAPPHVSGGAEVKEAGKSGGPSSTSPFLHQAQLISLKGGKDDLSEVAGRERQSPQLCIWSSGRGLPSCLWLATLASGNQPLPQEQFGDHNG